MKKGYALLPMLAGFFVMGFSDIIGTVMNQVKAECALSDVTAGFLPSMIFIWFFLISIPTGVMCGKIGRKNTVLVSLGVTVFAMLLPLAASAERFWIYFISFALLGIGNTIIQAALPALMSNVVAPDQLTSRISLGQFVKAICAALTPVFVYITATALGNWKLLFPLYGALTVVAALWLWFTPVPDERDNSQTSSNSNSQTSFKSCLAMLKHPYVLAMTVGILFSVGADVGFAVAIPEYLKNVYKVDLNTAGMGPTVYFVAKTLAAIGGAALFAKVSAAKCFPWCMGLGILATVGIFFAGTPFVFLACVFVAALATANSFGMCMGLALDKVPEKANEITSLMVMAIVGGGIVTPVLGIVQGSAGAAGVVCVLLVCLAYLLGLGLFAGRAPSAVVSTLALVTLLGVGGCLTEDASAVPVESPRICAHRGGRHEYDDNAVGGFVASLKAGVRGYETDVRETVDGELVIMHDAKVDRTTTGTGDITKMTLAEVRKLRLKKSGEPVPTLAEVLRPFAGRKDVWIELEMKSHQGDVDAYTRKIHDTAARILEPGTFAIIGFSPEHVQSVMRQFPEQKSSFTVARPLDDRAIADAKCFSGNGVGTFLKGTKKEMVDKAHAAGLRVAMWMINTKEEYELAKSLGADTVTSDYPIRLLKDVKK